MGLDVLALFQRGKRKREKNRWWIATDSNVVVDARGGNSHEAGGARLAVLNLSPGSDWPCTRRSLVTVLLLENWRGAEFLKPSPEGFRPMASLVSFCCHLFPSPFVESTIRRRYPLIHREHACFTGFFDKLTDITYKQSEIINSLIKSFCSINIEDHWRLNSKKRSDISLAIDMVNRKKIWRKTWRSGRWYLSD